MTVLDFLLRCGQLVLRYQQLIVTVFELPRDIPMI